MIYDRMVNEIRAVAEGLGGEPVLGRSLRTETDLQAAIREGFPQKVLKEVAQSAGITLGELAASLDLSAHSLQRRRKEGRLARFESDRVYGSCGSSPWPNAIWVTIGRRYDGSSVPTGRWAGGFHSA